MNAFFSTPKKSYSLPWWSGEGRNGGTAVNVCESRIRDQRWRLPTSAPLFHWHRLYWIHWGKNARASIVLLLLPILSHFLGTRFCMWAGSLYCCITSLGSDISQGSSPYSPNSGRGLTFWVRAQVRVQYWSVSQPIATRLFPLPWSVLGLQNDQDKGHDTVHQQGALLSTIDNIVWGSGGEKTLGSFSVSCVSYCALEVGIRGKNRTFQQQASESGVKW